MDIYTCKAKRLSDGAWKHGYVGRSDYMANKWFLFGVDMVVHEIDPDTICRHIGWNDRHGTPIFENDIVEFTIADTSYKYLVWWNKESNMMTAVPFDGVRFNGYDYYSHLNMCYEDFCLMLCDPYCDYRDIKVIGNTFDNPELMENVAILDFASEDFEF